MIREIVYLGKDNTIDLQLKADGSAVDLSGVTKMELIVGDTTISSANSPDAFDWSKHGSGTDEDDRRLILALGDEAIDTGTYYEATLIIYDPTNTDGIVWGTLVIRVKE